MNEPLTKLTGLYEKTSAKGNRYFVGRLGAAKLVMLANTDKKTDADPDWWVYVQERSEQPSTERRAEPAGRGAF